jgi:hypothetical protein
MRWLAILFAAGCASAGQDQPGIDSGGGGGSDSGGGSGSDSGMEMIDAPITMPDMGPTMRTLTQTNSQTLTPGNTLACSNNTTGHTRANTFYRVFDLPAMGITTAFTVQKVTFQVEHCHHNSNTGCVLAVRVGTYTATPGASLNTANMVIAASNANVQVPEVIENPGPPPTTPGGTVDAPVNTTIAAGSKLLVVLEAPDGNNLYSFYPATNTGGETGLGYIMSATCNITAPVDMSGTLNGQVTAAPRNLLLSVTGTY